MPLVAREYSAPSTLADVLQAVVDLFAGAGSATPVLVGENYVDGSGAQSIGSPPCVILVPEPGGGACELSAPYETGRAAMHLHRCDVLVRAAEPGDDIGRHRAAYALSDFVAGAVRRSGAGRLMFGRASRPYPSPFSADTGAGVQLCWGFAFERDIALATPVYAVAPAAEDDTPAAPYGVPGETGTLNTFTGAIVATEDEDA